jgi:hypothetical protein
MARWALITGGVVELVTEQATQPTPGTWVDVTGQHVGPGYTYNGTTFAAPPRLVSLTQRDFWRRFTVAEREALQDMLDNGTAVQKKKLKAFRDYVQTGMNVELFDDYIIASVTVMETAGVIAAGRAAIILG